jgi:hypothetical protein
MLHPVGLRNALARWLHGAEHPPETLQDQVRALRRDVDALQLERPAFVAELESLLGSCQDILGRAESARARVSARESRERRGQQGPELVVDPNDREAVKANVRMLLRSQGKLVQ